MTAQTNGVSLLAFMLTYVGVAGGCYASHTPEDASTPSDVEGPAGDLPFGVMYDHPDGRFREVFLADRPLQCEMISYRAPDTTGYLTDESLRPWMSLVHFRDGRQSYLFHTETTNIGPGDATITFPAGAGLGTGRRGDVLRVRWATDIVSVGMLGGTSTVDHCGQIVFP